MTTQSSAYADAFATFRSQGKVRLDAWVERVVDHIPVSVSPYLVDIGCGVGRFSRPLSKHSRCVIGVDKSPHMLRQASTNKTENCLYICGIAESLPIVSDSADVAFASMVLEHVDDKDLFFSEASRILRSDGVFILRTMLPEDIDATTWYSFIPTANRLEMQRTLGLASLEDFARSSGLCIVKSQTFTDVVEAEVTRHLPQRLLNRSYEILSKVPDEELHDAVASLNSDGLIEKTSSSLVLLRKCL